jgi:hypothetical protein
VQLQHVLRRVVKSPGLAIERLGERLVALPYDELRALASRGAQRPVINQREFRIVSLRRAGHHAVIDWLMRQLSGEVVHLNDLRPTVNPYRQYWLGAVRGKGHGAVYRRRDLAGIELYSGDQGEERLLRDSRGDFQAKDALLLNYEDCGIERVFSKRSRRLHDLHVGRSAELRNVLILRDPFNWLASRLKIGFRDVKGPRVRTMIDLWLEYAREFLGETTLVPRPTVFVNYNRWFSDLQYRGQLAEELGVPLLDEGIGQVATHAGGSSFDGTAFAGRAQDMKVLERWRTFSKDEEFRRLINTELFDYSERLFGPIPGTDELRP